MLTANVCGWSPAADDDDDVPVVHGIHFMALRPFASSSSSFLSPICPPLDPAPPKICPPQPQPMPLAPLTRASHSPIAPSSDRRAQSKRNRDPSWIPRPRNAFIIFRCEYSREHSQGSQESQNDNDLMNASVKTLSKRAADAWKELSASEKDRYKVLAEREREEHARLYPHYRFRPMKRQASGTRKMSCERPQHGPTRVASQECPPILSTHLPSVLSSAPTKSQSNISVERADVVSMPQIIGAPFSEPSSVDSQANPGIPLSLDFDDAMLFYPSPEATLLSETSPAASVELFSSSPFCPSTFGIPDSFRCNEFGLDPTQDDPERAQALEAYAMGLYNYDLFSPFTFPEHG